MQRRGGTKGTGREGKDQHSTRKGAMANIKRGGWASQLKLAGPGRDRKTTKEKEEARRAGLDPWEGKKRRRKWFRDEPLRK